MKTQNRIKITLYLDTVTNNIEISNVRAVYETVNYFNFKDGKDGKGFGSIFNKDKGGMFVYGIAS